LHGLFPHHSDLLECLGKPISWWERQMSPVNILELWL
jgi:hypothetical protein